MADWVTLTIELEGCEPIDCRVPFEKSMWGDATAIWNALHEATEELATRAEQLIESRGYGRTEP